MDLKQTPLLRHLIKRARLTVSVVLGVVLYAALPTDLAGAASTRFLISWNCAVALYLLLIGLVMAGATPETIRERAIEQEEGGKTLLLLVVLTAVAILTAIVVELSAVSGQGSRERQGRIALTALTVVSSWAFTHLMFAVHYAHHYYSNLERNEAPGIQFPGNEPPQYGDFLYLAGVIGTSGQTADIAFSSRPMRRVALGHCILAFAFNTTVLALTVNIAASLLQG
ncbi:MAG: DUF1345 domain-containing protein [Rhodoferax sp.]|nr:DUF1345 domain-containing protein [Rhodoferax sp.]